MTTNAPSPRQHRPSAITLIVIGTLVGVLAIFSLWINRQLLDSDNYAETSVELLEEPAIRTQVAGFLTDELYANVDVQGEIAEALPPAFQPLVAPAAGALRNGVESAANELLQRPRVLSAWEASQRAAHDELLFILEGGGDVLSTEQGNVTLDLKALLTQTQERFGFGGRLEQRLPEDAAEIQVMQSDELDTAQSVLNLLRGLPIVLIALVLACFGGAVALARGWRRQALTATGFGFAVAGILALIGRNAAGDYVVDTLASSQAVVPAADAAWNIVTSLLVEAAHASVFMGAVIVLAAWLAAPSAIAVRRTLAPYLREPAFAYGGLAAILLGLFYWGPTPASRTLWGGVIITALFVIGLEALRRQTAREFPGATREEAARLRREKRERRQQAKAAPAPAPAPTAAPRRADARLDSLERLVHLRDEGVLAPEEFEREKARVLEGAAAS